MTGPEVKRRRKRGVSHAQPEPTLHAGKVMLLGKNIMEQLTQRGILPLEDLRERLCCASDLRMRAAIDELRRMHLIQVSDGRDQLVRLMGERRPYGHVPASSSRRLKPAITQESP